MFFRKLQASTIIGAVLSVIYIGASLANGAGLFAGIRGIPGAMVIGAMGVFWFTRNMDDDGNFHQSTSAPEVGKLRRQLRSAVQHAVDCEARGDHGRAAYWRSQVAILESELRSFGA